MPAVSASIFDFVDPDGIQLEFTFIDQDKLRLSSYPVASESDATRDP
jgi:hypothetical protein